MTLQGLFIRLITLGYKPFAPGMTSEWIEVDRKATAWTRFRRIKKRLFFFLDNETLP